MNDLKKTVIDIYNKAHEFTIDITIPIINWVYSPIYNRDCKINALEAEINKLKSINNEYAGIRQTSITEKSELKDGQSAHWVGLVNPKTSKKNKKIRVERYDSDLDAITEFDYE